MENVKLRRFLSIFVAALLLTYVGYQVYLLTREDLVVETAAYASVSETIQTEAFSVRNEQLVTASYSGVIDYTVSDGSRVSTGGVIADIYQNERDATLKARIQRLDSEIEMLNALAYSEEHYLSNPELLSTQIYSSLGGIYTAINSGDFSNLSLRREEFQMAINRKNIITGDESKDDYIARIAELEAEKAEIQSTAGGRTDYVVAPMAGYFISTEDGYENSVDFKRVADILPGKVRALLRGEEKPAETSTAIGKICTEFNWYLICVLNNDDVLRLENVTNVNIEIPFATTEKIPAEIIAKNKDDETGEIAVVFRCSNMDSDIAKVRREPIKIEVQTYSGVLVNEKAIRFNDIEKEYELEDGTTQTVLHENVKGVYVKSGSQMKFVQIFTERTINGYAICKTELSEEQQGLLVTDETIHLYDEVIMEGVDLYDGKFIY